MRTNKSAVDHTHTCLTMRLAALSLFAFLQAALLVAAAHVPGVSPESAHPTARIPVARNPGTIGSRQSTGGANTLELPEVRYKVFVHGELIREPKSIRARDHLYCHHQAESKWNVSNHPAGIRFVWSEAGSGLAADDVRHVLNEAGAAWDEEAPEFPGFNFEQSFLLNPSTLKSGARNGQNEIAFAEPRTKHAGTSILAEAYVWKNHTSGEIVEVDIVFHAASTDVVWSTDHSPQYGRAFDLHSVAVACLGHAIGAGLSEEHLHSTFGLTAPGEKHKRTLECGDKQAARKLYSRS